MYRLTEYNSWLRLSSVAEEVGSNFSNNLQYQSLYLSDYAQIIRENKLDTKEELEDFARKLLLNAGVYEVYVLLPDNRVLGEKGKLIYNESPGAFGKISKKGEHYSDILHNYENPSSFLINHYYPVDVDGKIKGETYLECRQGEHEKKSDDDWFRCGGRDEHDAPGRGCDVV